MPNSQPPSISSKSKEPWLIGFLCLLAAVHVSVFSAAFPFFNNVDEHYHFDQAVKYSHLHVPKKPEYFSEESLQYMVVFATWEYVYTNDTLNAPPWKQPGAVITPILLSREKRWQIINREFSQPPLYYLVVGSWWRLCDALGCHDALQLYLLRFINALFIIVLVLIGRWAASLVFPGETFLRLGVPAVLALMPQATFYCISNDILSPLSFGLAFVCLLYFWRAETPGVWLGIFTGLTLAATFLTKITNLPLLAISFAFILLKICQLAKSGKVKSSLPSLIAMFSCAALPIATWMAWCRCFYGDFTGSAPRIRLLHWTLKPLSAWWDHPIFTLAGVWTYLSGQLGTLWQGEFLWHNDWLILPWTNSIFTAFSLLLLVAVFPALFPKFSNAVPLQRHALQFSLACFTAALAFFALLSIIYDYHDCANPSQEYPYFRSGRLILGSLVPFALLLVYGLDRLLNRFGTATKFVILGVIISSMLALEIVTDLPVFSSQYNWFHM